MARSSKRFRPTPLTTRKKWLLAAVVGLPILGVFAFSNRGLISRLSLEARHDRAEQELLVEERLRDSLRQEIERLHGDTAAIEKVARERYGMVRPGERIFTVDEGE